MIKTYDGSSFKRVGGKPGDRSPASGFTRLRVVYTATGGETSIDLSALNSQFSYQPGNAHIEVKRSSGGPLIAGIDFFETSSTAVGFPAADPLLAGEIVEVTRQVAVSGVMALSARPDLYETTATAGQTSITASFSWPYAMNPCGVRLYINGIRQRRDVDFFETSLGSGNTNQVSLADALVGGENIIMEPSYQAIDQTAAATTFNSQQLSGIQSTLAAGAQGFVDETTKISVPSTSIVNRAKIPDIANDLRALLGIDRIPVQQLYELQTEFGSSGERVLAVANDDRGLIRFVGSGWSNTTGTSGIFQSTAVVNDYVEVTFYGTGLNLLKHPNASGVDFRVSVDGGAEGSNLGDSTSIASVLATRNYTVNMVVPVASGLSLGIHTVKIRNNTVAGALQISGFEIVNASSSNLHINPGTGFVSGQAHSSITAQSLAYNYAATGTRGGRAVVYQKADGTIGQAFQAVDSTQKTLTNTDHTNEEVVRILHATEFGANRSDDFSTVKSAGNAVFTLEDGTTTLVASLIDIHGVSGPIIRFGTSNNFVAITFVGTGLDIIRQDLVAGTIDTYTVTVDGSSVGSLSTTANLNPAKVSIVSGLPYGTHTVKISAGTLSQTGRLGIKQFIVYQPKKPSIPSGTVELADYNVMANYVANTSELTIATGVLRKNSLREITYVNGTGGTTSWSTTLAPTVDTTTGSTVYTDRQNAYIEYTFFGTGFEYRGEGSPNRSANIQVSLQSLSTGGSLINLTTTNFPTISSGAYGSGIGFNATTGIFDLQNSGTTGEVGFYVSNLPMGLYKLRLLNNTASAYLTTNCIDIITPIHSHKSNLYYDAQNTLPVGSCSLSDNRAITLVKDTNLQKKNIAQAIGITSGPTTTSTVLVPMPDMSVVHTNKSGKIKVTYTSSLTNSGTGDLYQSIFIDGIEMKRVVDNGKSGLYGNRFDSFVFAVSPGVHKIDIYWAVGSGTATCSSTLRSLLVEEM